MKLWIARNKSGSLLLFNHIPLSDKSGHWLPLKDNTDVSLLDYKYFPEVTYENSPQIIELKLVKDACKNR